MRMRSKVLCVVVATMMLAGCSSSAPAPTAKGPLDPGTSASQTRARGIVFQETYMRLHHVGRATAQCVQGLVGGTDSPAAMEAGLHVNPRHARGVNCLP